MKRWSNLERNIGILGDSFRNKTLPRSCRLNIDTKHVQQMFEMKVHKKEKVLFLCIR